MSEIFRPVNVKLIIGERKKDIIVNALSAASQSNPNTLAIVIIRSSLLEMNVIGEEITPNMLFGCLQMVQRILDQDGDSLVSLEL